MDLDALVVSAKAGDGKALNQLLIASQCYAIRVVDGFLGTKYSNRLDVEDVVQEVLVKVAADIATVKSQTWGSYLGWLRLVCRNTTYNAIKAVKAPSRGVDVTEQMRVTDFIGTSREPVQIMEAREDLESLNVLAGQMGKNTKGVVTLLAQGYNYDEIASSLGLTIGSCYSLVKRFRASALVAAS